VLDVQGVGYEVFVPARCHASLPPPPAAVTLHIHTHVREEAFTLYGFLEAEDRSLFRLLLGVAGIGPRTALALIGEMTLDEVREAIVRGDKRRFAKVSGIGGKTAERITLELRDKLPARVNGHHGPAPVVTGGTANAAVEALINLGFGRGEAESAVARVADEHATEPVEALLRHALSTLS
jgi:Holliday junction DNA helicase RuvA